MKVSVIVFFAVIINFKLAYSQIPVQIFGNHKSIEYNFLWFKDIGTKQKINIFNYTYFTVDYGNYSKNAYEIHQTVTYNLTQHWGLASGGRFTDGQFVPQIAVSYQLQTEDLYLNLFPSFQYFNQHKKFGYSLFGLLFYKPKINDCWRMFNQLVFESLYASKSNAYLYQQIRIGLEYNSIVQFGLGMNLEQIGLNNQFNSNFGVFVRKELD